MRIEDYPGLNEIPLASVELRDEEETRRLGRWIATEVESPDFVGLIGDLGAGKTTLMKGLTEKLSTTDVEALSPTYALVQVYETVPPIIHMDLYRLQNWDDLESIGYWDYLDSTGIVCVEWLDRIPGAWPQRGMIIELSRRPYGREATIWVSKDRFASMNEPDLSVDSEKTIQERK